MNFNKMSAIRNFNLYFTPLSSTSSDSISSALYFIIALYSSYSTSIILSLPSSVCYLSCRVILSYLLLFSLPLFFSSLIFFFGHPSFFWFISSLLFVLFFYSSLSCISHLFFYLTSSLLFCSCNLIWSLLACLGGDGCGFGATALSAGGGGGYYGGGGGYVLYGTDL